MTSVAWRVCFIISAICMGIGGPQHPGGTMQEMLAGRPTPVFSAHMMLTMIVYPIFAVLISGFIIAAARERALGNLWVAWIGVAGALAHGTAGFFTVAVESEFARQLFPLIMLLMTWALIVGLLPARSPAAVPSRTTSLT
jgi:hypothetical protein